jgi:hypothetical protein
LPDRASAFGDDLVLLRRDEHGEDVPALQQVLSRRARQKSAIYSLFEQSNFWIAHPAQEASLSPENEQMTTERICTDYLLRLHSQTIEPIA